jgi:hypothetical protein
MPERDFMAMSSNTWGEQVHAILLAEDDSNDVLLIQRAFRV